MKRREDPQFKEKVAVITGAGSGIGRALAQQLAGAGAHLALSDVNRPGLDETLRLLPQGSEARGYTVDVSSCAAVFGHADEVVHDFGAAHLIFNNAGATVAGTVDRTSIEEFEWLLAADGVQRWHDVDAGCQSFLPKPKSVTGHNHKGKVNGVLDHAAARFDNLKDYPFEPHFARVDDCGLLMHYVDEGPASGAVVLMLHGNPTWSYLYRAMIPICVDAGLRVIAPDLIGYGKSSKPVRWQDYTYQRHCDWVRRVLEQLDVHGITLFCQDWGSLIGLRLVTQADERFARVAVANGALGLAGTSSPSACQTVVAGMKPSPSARCSSSKRSGRNGLPSSSAATAETTSRSCFEGLSMSGTPPSTKACTAG